MAERQETAFVPTPPPPPAAMNPAHFPCAQRSEWSDGEEMRTELRGGGVVGGTREAGLGQRERKNETHGCFPAVIPK